MHEEAELIKGLKAGSHECFEKLIIRYRSSAIAFAQKYIHDPFLAEDIVQDSFAEVYVYRHRFKEGYSFKTYLFSIVKHKSIDYIRKKQRDPVNEEGDSTLNTLEHEVLAREKSRFIQEKMNELKREYRAVIYLIDFEGFSYEEAGKIMGKNLGQVKVLIFRARKKLKALLEREV